jgi:glycosyltransferase involved in cell wall biosynthesis
MKMKLLYLGNKLSSHGLNKTTVETLGENLLEEGFTVVSVSGKKNFFLRFLEMFWVTLTARNISYLLIDTYSTKAFWYAFICSQIARIRNINYIPILHGGDLPNRLKNNPKLAEAVFKNACQNVAPSNYLKSEFEKYGFTNVVYIPNTIAIENYSFKKRATIEPHLLWVRAFATIYNPEMAVRVLHQLQAHYPNATLTMVGPDKDGSMETTKALAFELNVAVHFTGKLSKEAWWQLSSRHDVFINTTHFDNTPVSVMEAMALGLPVVSTNVGGIPYLVENENTALLVNDNDVETMVYQIDRLLQDEVLVKKLSLNGRQLAETWDWKKVKVLWHNLLK